MIVQKLQGQGDNYDITRDRPTPQYIEQVCATENNIKFVLYISKKQYVLLVSIAKIIYQE